MKPPGFQKRQAPMKKLSETPWPPPLSSPHPVGAEVLCAAEQTAS